MGPDRLALDLNINGPDDPFGIDRVTLDADFNPGRLPAYGEVLAGVFDSDPTLSVRGDTAEECWRIVDPVLRGLAAGRGAAGGVPGRIDRPIHLEPIVGPTRRATGVDFLREATHVSR